MKNKVIALFALFCLISCKKKYDCDCYITDVNQTKQEEQHFTVKSKDQKSAFHSCVNTYLETDRSTNGEAFCDVN
jgi:hypothetical protein